MLLINYSINKIKTLTDIGWDEVNPGSSEGDPTLVTTSQVSLQNQTNMLKHNCSCSRKFLKNPIPLNLN